MTDPNILGLGLLYVGAVLFVNALYILDYASPRDTAILNLFTGSLTFLNAIYLAFILESTFPAAQTLLFSFTYLWLFIVFWYEWTDMRALGWYCLFVAITAIPTGIYTYTIDNLEILGIIWQTWAYLWFIFFLYMALELKIKKITAWSTMAIAIITGIYAYYTLAITGAPI
ncbi:Acid-activated urea channel AmiS/UreI family [Methanonatronarchaeum thermophilum]|uniref:Acid-activated urea channel AmiS/UreI family n=1 Tax=Methanonatronarchaeum thermophilum TaxID=1927129 RepID=A0A1Y3GE59_9EURY|nr:AmiS/UreI family transporter [Methanonatronarchaeum thermophilum]OUJ18583.1 Acid-activated urea channel AmiS/UreI family [Methanonatronarchaeum thermophilum]